MNLKKKNEKWNSWLFEEDALRIVPHNLPWLFLMMHVCFKIVLNQQEEDMGLEKWGCNYDIPREAVPPKINKIRAFDAQEMTMKSKDVIRRGFESALRGLTMCSKCRPRSLKATVVLAFKSALFLWRKLLKGLDFCLTASVGRIKKFGRSDWRSNAFLSSLWSCDQRSFGSTESRLISSLSTEGASVWLTCDQRSNW